MQYIRHYWGGAAAHAIHFTKVFFRAIFPSQMLCQYLELLKSYKASKLTIRKKCPQKCNMFGLTTDAVWDYTQCRT